MCITIAKQFMEPLDGAVLLIRELIKGISENWNGVLNGNK